jgi:Mn-dependent DtxR family transcriptional regulator
MANQVWKEYEENQLTHSAAHYLMTIHELLAELGYARVTDIAKRLNITRGSCSISLKPLKRRGLVVEDENKFLRLSDEGLRLAAQVERNDALLETFFREVLLVSSDQAEIDACKIEHLLSLETSMRLANFMAHMQSESDAVRAFREELRRRDPPCDDPEHCVYCKQQCLLDEQVSIEPAPPR